MTRILLLSPADLELPDDVIANGVTDSDTEIVHRRVIYPSVPPIGAHDWTLADLAVMAAGQNAEAEGFDAVCLADFGDYGANALRSLMETCYGFRSDLRLVRGPDGRAWVVMHIQEGMRWDPEIEMRRQDWLCCATAGDRRYITPVPPGWKDWSDLELVGAVVRARPDLRGPD